VSPATATTINPATNAPAEKALRHTLLFESQRPERTFAPKPKPDPQAQINGKESDDFGNQIGMGLDAIWKDRAEEQTGDYLARDHKRQHESHHGDGHKRRGLTPALSG
jgi:hypothetical protein